MFAALLHVFARRNPLCCFCGRSAARALACRRVLSGTAGESNFMPEGPNSITFKLGVKIKCVLLADPPDKKSARGGLLVTF